MTVVPSDKIEFALQEIMKRPIYPVWTLEYERLLMILGNVDEEELVALVVLALENTAKEGG